MKNLSLKVKKSTSAGFSLVELMIAMMIVLVMLAILSTVLIGINHQLKTQKPRLEAVNNAQTAVDAIVRLIRMAGSRPVGCPVTFQVNAPSASNSLGNGHFGKLRLQSDWNSADCSLTGVDEDVTFSVNNNMLFLDADQQVPLVDKISSLRFLFYDRNNSLITDPSSQPASISFIHVEVDTVPINGFTTTISSAATVRR